MEYSKRKQVIDIVRLAHAPWREAPVVSGVNNFLPFTQYYKKVANKYGPLIKILIENYGNSYKFALKAAKRG